MLSKYMESSRKKILIIDDSVETIKILIEVLKPHYEVFFSTDGDKGVGLAQEKAPDLILLDIMMEPTDGYEVCRRLKIDVKTKNIPIIFLSAISEAMDEAKGFEFGGADFITKPFTPITVLARIKNHIKLSESMKELKRLYSLALDSNPITRFPGNNSIRKHIENLITEKQNRIVLYCDLDNFKAYNDKYGFANGDKVILATADLMKLIGESLEIEDIFLGHIGGDDFVITMPKKFSEDYVKSLLDSFGEMKLQFYNEEDREKGYIEAKNRKGDDVRYPLLSVSIAGVDLSNNHYSKYLEVSDTCADLKKKVKKLEGDNYIIDRRKN